MKSKEIIDAIMKEAFASPKQRSEFEEMIRRSPDVEEVYSTFVVNKLIPFTDMIDMIVKNEAILPKGFREQFLDYHRKFKQKQENYRQINGGVVAKVDKFTIVNTYRNLARTNVYETFKAVIKLIQEAVEKIKTTGFDAIIYGEIYLRNPQDSKSVADYNPRTDEISLRLYKTYSGHALDSVIHELAHRIWYRLMNERDKGLWINEFNNKINRIYKGKYPDFPRDYSKKNPREYFATVIEEFMVRGKRFSELIDLII